MANDASSGVGNSSARTVDAHVPREWEEPASEAQVCAEEVAAPREPMRGRFSAEAAPASSRSSCRQGSRKAPSGSSSTAQSKAPSRSNCQQGRRKAPSGSSFTAQSKAPSGRATCRTISIAMRNLPNRHHREAATARDGAKHHREAAPQRKARHHREANAATEGAMQHRESNLPNQQHRESNLPNQQHREEHFLSNNGAKRAGAEGVRGRNLACFLKNFVSNYIVIFLMMLFRVHL